MPAWLVYGNTLENTIAHVLGMDCPPLPIVDIKVRVDLTNAEWAKVKADPLLHQVIFDECKAKLVERMTPALRPAVMSFKAALRGASGQLRQRRDDIVNATRASVQQLQPEFRAIVDKRLTKLAAEVKDYKGYRKDVAIKTVTTSVSAGLAVAGLAGAAGTGGATLALAIVGGYRAITDGVALIADCAISAQQAERQVTEGIASLRAAYAANKTAAAAREVGVSGLAAVANLPTSVVGLATAKLGNVASIEGQNTLWRAKLTHLRFFAHELSRDLAKLLDDLDRLQATLGPQPAMRKRARALEKLESEIRKLLTKGFYVASMGRRVVIAESHVAAEAGLARQQLASDALADLKAQRSSWVDRADLFIKTGVSVGLMAASYGMTASGPPMELLDAVSTGIGAACDGWSLLNTVQDTGEQFDVDLAQRVTTTASAIVAKYKAPPPPVPPRPQQAVSTVTPRTNGAPTRPLPPLPTNSVPRRPLPPLPGT